MFTTEERSRVLGKPECNATPASPQPLLGAQTRTERGGVGRRAPGASRNSTRPPLPRLHPRVLRGAAWEVGVVSLWNVYFRGDLSGRARAGCASRHPRAHIPPARARASFGASPQPGASRPVQQPLAGLTAFWPKKRGMRERGLAWGEQTPVAHPDQKSPKSVPSREPLGTGRVAKGSEERV